jgi:hypothetical protein
MRRLLYLLLTFTLAVSACKHADKNIHLNKRKPDDYQVKIKIPAEWIEKVRGFDYSRNTKPLLREFENFIKPDTLINENADHVDSDYGRMFDPLFVDLDSEPGDELICLLGWDISCPSLVVFKKQLGDWYLIYLEQVNTFYSAPVLSVANNFSPNKTFYYRQVDGHGSDVYFDSYNFYKLIDGKVYKCLNLTGENHSYGGGSYRLYMNQEIRSRFEFSGDDSDYINVGFSYNFFIGKVDPLINAGNSVGYKWDGKNRTYKLDILPYQNKADGLIAQKIDCFANFSDSLFVKAFKGEIDEVLKTGTPQQKKILRQYLDQVKKDKKTKTEMELITLPGGATYYAPKERK